MKTFVEAAMPREVDVQTEAEMQLHDLMRHLKYFYERGVHVVVKPTRTGYSLDLKQPKAVVVQPK